ncbi:MAG TPA: Na+/H+ antiporter NhaA [Campylobacterales bacterium]|nr:Na+/H+ antiporter NhaA [Campylobacterales bacterium]
MLQQNKPIDTISKPLRRFLHLEAASGIMLIFFTVLALAWANSPFKDSYYGMLHAEFTVSLGDFVFSHSLQHLVNDALMCVFFFIIGLELKREFAEGELKNPKSAALPIFAAFGGMIVPALLFLTINDSEATRGGWGIVMATDIAFAVGVMALLGSRISSELKIFLLTLAVVDDIGAILVIAIFYSGDIGFGSLGLSLLFVGLIAFFYKLGIRNLFFFAVLFVISWFFMLDSGIHSTILGVILGLMAPSTPEHSKESFFEKMEHLKEKFFHAAKEEDHHQKTKALQGMSALSFSSMSMLERLEMFFHPWNIFYVLPLFALFNAGFEPNSDSIFSGLSIAIAISLFVGKPLGVVVFSYLGVVMKFASLPPGSGFRQILGVGFLAGIGFTMSIFISALAFTDDSLVSESKGGIFMASLLSGFIGYFVLKKGSNAA